MHVFTLLGDPVRLRIVEILASGSHTAGELAAAISGDMGISRTAVSHQLRTLRDHGFVVTRPDENVREYRLHWDALQQLDTAILDLYEKWDRRFGWPYESDPLAPLPARRHRLAERAQTQRPHQTPWEVEPRARADDVPEDWFIAREE
jgi:DNA-binding transcriptional ArsR family regulator